MNFWARKHLSLLSALVLTLIFAGVSFYFHLNFWGPILYQDDVRRVSPDGSYTLIVLRGDVSAISDFTYRIYIFPADITPKEMPKDKSVRLTDLGQFKRRYLVYVGDAIPEFRWTSNHEVEIDLNDLYDEVDEFHPVPQLTATPQDSRSAVLVSLVLNRENKDNVMP
jgi:hypothetical protein